MLSQLPKAFGEYPITRQWIPKGVPQSGSKPLPRDGLAPRPGKLLADVQKIVVGDTGYRGLTAKAAASDRAQAYGHLIVDNEAIFECIPALTSGVGLVEQAHFVRARPGSSFNAEESAMAVNLCFGGRIDPKQTYDRCVALVAFICWRFGLQADAVIGARDLDPARDDPEQPLKAAGQDMKALSGRVADLVSQAKQERPAPQ